MSTIFAGIPGVVVFLDDIMVHGVTLATHNEYLARVLDVLARHTVTLNEEKCTFAALVIKFVGFRLSAEGLSPLHSNVEACCASQSLPVQHIYGDGGLLFLSHYSTTTSPLRELLKQDAVWDWTPACSAAVRQQLTSPPVLAFFDLASPIFVTCDVSNTAVGAVLSQLQGENERPVDFASRSLNAAEQKYSVGEQEALACVWACELWHMYLCTSGSPVQLVRVGQQKSQRH